MKLKSATQDDLSEAVAWLMAADGFGVRGGDIEVLIDFDDIGPYTPNSITHKVAEADQYPEDFSMPEGFEFLEISE